MLQSSQSHPRHHGLALPFLLLLLLLVTLSSTSAFLLPASSSSSTPARTRPSTAVSATTPPNPLDKYLRAASLVALTLLPAAAPAGAFDTKGARLFEENCASCHVAGGNIIGYVRTVCLCLSKSIHPSTHPPTHPPTLSRYARGKTLKQEALAKYKVNTRDSIVHMLQDGKGVMPRYTSYTRKNGDVVPAKLTDQEMALVADYVLEQAKAGWK